MNRKNINETRARRVKRSRAKIFGTSEKPRLAVFRSNRYSYAQLIDDVKGNTLLQVSTRELEKEKKPKAGEAASESVLGEKVAKQAVEKGIKQAVFDRRGNKYHGRIRKIVEAARQGGLKI